MRKIILMAMSLFLLLPAPVQAKRISHTENDFIIARKVDVRVDGTYMLLDSVAEKPGVYDFPCYTAWDYTASYDYEPGYNPFKIHKIKQRQRRKSGIWQKEDWRIKLTVPDMIFL